SGMAAISSVIESLPEEKPKRIVMADDMYFGVRTMLMGTDIGRRFDIVTADMTDLDKVKSTIESAQTGLVWMETPTNPQIKIIDIDDLAGIALVVVAYAVVNYVPASRVLQQPRLLGVDFPLHSVTKYIGGHRDLLLGAVIAAADNDMLKNLRTWQH